MKTDLVQSFDFSLATLCCLLDYSMEETVRTLLQNQDPVEGPKVDPMDLMKAYKVQKGLLDLQY